MKRNVQDEAVYAEGRVLLVKALFALSEELKQVAIGLQEGTIPFGDCEEVIGQTIERSLGHIL